MASVRDIFEGGGKAYPFEALESSTHSELIVLMATSFPSIDHWGVLGTPVVEKGSPVSAKPP